MMAGCNYGTFFVILGTRFGFEQFSSEIDNN